MRLSCWIRFAVLSLGLGIATLAFTGAQTRGYAPGVLVVQYRDGITVAPSPLAIEPSRLISLRARDERGELSERDVPRYTGDARTNRVLLEIGVVRSERIFGAASREPPTYRLRIIGERVEDALARLRALPTVMYASPDWYVSPMH